MFFNLFLTGLFHILRTRSVVGLWHEEWLKEFTNPSSKQWEQFIKKTTQTDEFIINNYNFFGSHVENDKLLTKQNYSPSRPSWVGGFFSHGSMAWQPVSYCNRNGLREYFVVVSSYHPQIFVYLHFLIKIVRRKMVLWFNLEIHVFRLSYWQVGCLLFCTLRKLEFIWCI